MTYKTAYYSFYLPVACGLHLAGAATDDALATAKGILIKMGQYFQIQDDYLDCFADAETLGKVGTDIQDNKCSWLVCKALEQASDVQRGVISDNYGKDDAECIAKVKAVFACAAHHTAFVCPPFALCVHVHPTTLCVLQRKNGIPTGLASLASRKATQTRTVHEAKHRWLNNPRRNQTKKPRKDKSRALSRQPRQRAN